MAQSGVNRAHPAVNVSFFERFGSLATENEGQHATIAAVLGLAVRA